MKCKLFSLFILVVMMVISCKTKKSSKASKQPQSSIVMATFPSCEKDKDKSNCTKNYISDLILEAIKNQHLHIRNDTLKVGFSVDIEGNVSPNSKYVVSTNKYLEVICLDVLKKLPLVKPAYDTRNNTFQYSVQSFYVIIMNNRVTNKI